LALLLGYVILSTVGVLVPQLQMYGDVIWKLEPGRRKVALTFDDGPHPRTTRSVLALLAERGHTATFFVVGAKMQRYPDVIEEIRAGGHSLGLHGFDHDRLYSFKPPAAVAEDIERGQELLERLIGRRTRWFRPPIGYVSHRTAAGAKRARVTTVAWSARGIDGLGSADPERVVARVRRGLRDGAIVLLHDAAERDDFIPATLEALPAILDALDERGLRSASLDELLIEDGVEDGSLSGGAERRATE
jgi:peptidoglycan/xylan/chitin deacetylase (PgdA/CDA1 family)